MTLPSHPVHRYWFVTKIAKTRWQYLAATFIGLVLVSAGLLGAARAGLYPDQFWDHAADESIKYLMILLDIRDASEPPGSGIIPGVLGLLAGIAKLVLLVGLFGTVVFKFLVIPDVFQIRKKASIERLPDNRFGLTLRVYNATKLEIVDIQFSAYLRVPGLRAKGARTVPNVEIAIAPGRDCWPIAIPFVPYSVNITLDENDVRNTPDSPNGTTLHAIQSTPITPQPVHGDGETFLVLIIKGKRPELGTEVIETHWFRLSGADPDVEFGKYEEIHVIPGSLPKQYGSKPLQWSGWDRFEMLEAIEQNDEERTFIFGYGSLVSRDSLARYLAQHDLNVSMARYCKLNGFRRAWNVAMNNQEDIPGYKYYVNAQSGERPRGFVTFLNIYRKADSFVNGVLFEVPRSVLPELDQRERNYERIDVTAAIDGEVVAGRAWVYVAKDRGLTRFNEGIANNSALIDQFYKNDVERAFRTIGDEAYKTYIASTDETDVPVRDLRRIDIPESARPGPRAS